MQSAFSQRAIQAAFGVAANRTLIAGDIHVVANYNALCAAYDNWSHDHGVIDPRTNAVWATGGLAADDAANGTRTNAFAEPTPGTGIYVDASGTDPTATVHEMLHINTGPEFRSAVGEIVNEGTTQRFAVQAVRAQGASVVGSENTYQAEQGVVQKLVDMVGEANLRTAYFNNPRALITAYELAAGQGSWAVLKALLDERRFTAANTLLDTGIVQAASVTAQNRIDAINEALSGWVSENDLADIRAIYNTADLIDKLIIRFVIEPRTHEVFWRSSTRMAVREIIGAL